jgi:adenylate cyclase
MTGRAFVGAVGSQDTVTDFTALGDAVNVAARLASAAAAGEILVSEVTYAAAGLVSEDLERRELTLKGKTESVGVRVMRVANS